MSSLVLALDQGTTSSRALLFDAGGALVGCAQREFRQYYPQPGWVEHDAEEIWESQSAVADEVMKTAGVTASDLAAVGIANQRETTVIWERDSGRPVGRAIVWQDRRTAAAVDAYKSGERGRWITGKTGLVPDPYFAGSKIVWMLEHQPDLRARAGRGELAFGTIDSWLLFLLTGGAVHATDASNAARTMLFNIHDGGWDEELLDFFGIPRGLLPDVRSSSGVYGEVSAELACRGVPVAGMAGDQNAALFGQLCHEEGGVKCTYGTGSFMLMNSGGRPRESAHHLLSTVAWRLGAETTYALEGSVFTSGAVVQWLRDGLGLINESEEVRALAGSVDDSDGVILVPAFTGLGAPHWDPHARGTMFGLTRGTTAAHIARAAVESMAFQCADLFDAMVADAGVAIPEMRVDGGAAGDDLLLQVQADLLRIPVVRPKMTETTALGVAYLAGLAVGLWQSADELQAQWAVDRVFEPEASADRIAEKRAVWSEAVRRSLGWRA